MEMSERSKIHNQILEYAKEQSGKGNHYAFAFGFVFAILTDEQLKNLEKYSK